MSRKAKLLTAVLAIAGLLTVSLTGVALADSQRNPDIAPDDCCEQLGLGRHGGQTGALVEVVGELLGLIPEEIQAQRQEGKSLVEIAEAQGISEGDLVEAIMTANGERLQERVEDGICTQEQANLRLQQMEQRIRQMVNSTTFGPSEARTTGGYGQSGEGTGPGGMRSWGMRGGQGACYGETGLGTGSGDMLRWGQSSR
jgi:hypothetical protein